MRRKQHGTPQDAIEAHQDTGKGNQSAGWRRQKSEKWIGDIVPMGGCFRRAEVDWVEEE